MRFLKEYVNKWHRNFDNKLRTTYCLSFILEIKKAIGKEKRTHSRFLHASYTFCMTKKGLLIGGWAGVGQLLVAAQQIVCLLLNRLKCQILQM
jgi:hypothetical protein